MKAPIRAFFIYFILVILTSCDLSAQWKNISPNLVIPYVGFHADPSLGAIHFKDGILWAGWKDLWSSKDSGNTWQKNSFNLQGDIISDINFFDQMNGVIAVNNDEFSPSAKLGVYLTLDGGLTWRQILSVLHCTQVAFDNAPNIIHALTQGDFPSPTGFFHTSTDGGATWTSAWPGGLYSQCFAIAKDQTIFVLNSGDASGTLSGFTSSSTNHGTTWQQSSTEVDGDSYTICADSCDPKRLYVANEDYLGTVNFRSDLFFTTNSGNTWASAVSFPIPYLCGGMIYRPNVIYASSLKNGIYRSIDQGLTWKNIGGPMDPVTSMSFDARNIACINDNIVFALDAQGSIWETTNSGGDSLFGLGINDLILSQNTIFSGDSLIVCDTSVSRFITLQPEGCTPPTLVKVEVIGSDSLSYTTIPLAGDSIGVNFLPLFDSLNNVNLVLTFSDGRQKIISLAGFGIPRAPLTFLAQDQVSDTLGGSVIIPISLNGLHKPENITVVLHYDTVLNYNGSFSSSGAQLDMPNEQWKGRSKLSIPNALPNSIIGFAHFDVFNDSVPIQHVTFDSLTVLSAISLCQYISPALATSIVTPLSGCGVETLSKYLHYGRMPDLKIVPNPAIGSASIISSMDLGEVNVTIYNMLGARQSRTSLTLAKNSPARLPLPLSDGVYEVRVNSVLTSYDLHVVVSK